MISVDGACRVGALGGAARRLLFLLGELFADLAVMLDRIARREILELEELADLDLAVALVRIGAALDPLDRLLQRLDLEDPVAGDQLLGLGERPVDDGALGAGEAYARALGARLQPGAFEH